MMACRKLPRHNKWFWCPGRSWVLCLRWISHRRRWAHGWSGEPGGSSCLWLHTWVKPKKSVKDPYGIFDTINLPKWVSNIDSHMSPMYILGKTSSRWLLVPFFVHISLWSSDAGGVSYLPSRPSGLARQVKPLGMSHNTEQLLSLLWSLDNSDCWEAQTDRNGW